MARTDNAGPILFAVVEQLRDGTLRVARSVRRGLMVYARYGAATGAMKLRVRTSGQLQWQHDVREMRVMPFRPCTSGTGTMTEAWPACSADALRRGLLDEWDAKRYKREGFPRTAERVRDGDRK